MYTDRFAYEKYRNTGVENSSSTKTSGGNYMENDMCDMHRWKSGSSLYNIYSLVEMQMA